MKKIKIFIVSIILSTLILAFVIYLFPQRERKAPLKISFKGNEIQLVSSGNEYRGFFKRKEGKAPSFTLMNQDGKEVSLGNFKGKAVVMTYIYTTCTYACPLLEAKLLDVQETFKDRLGKDLVLISVTMDPERDTPGRMKKHAEDLGADLKGWVFLTGSKKVIEKVLKDYQFFYKKQKNGEFLHLNRITIIDRDGNFAYEVNGLQYDTAPLIAKIREVLSD